MKWRFAFSLNLDAWKRIFLTMMLSRIAIVIILTPIPKSIKHSQRIMTMQSYMTYAFSNQSQSIPLLKEDIKVQWRYSQQNRNVRTKYTYLWASTRFILFVFERIFRKADYYIIQKTLFIFKLKLSILMKIIVSQIMSQ